jgi:hypothetical protein
VHTTGLAPWHAPAWQVSACVHALPSLQAVPLALAGFEQTPVATSQVPAVWHWSWAVHTTGFDPVHAPAWHESARVHALPSLHASPFGLLGFEQDPVLGLQVPAVWHWSSAAHTTGLSPTHPPLRHTSLVVQALPSLHAAPSLLAGFVHWPVWGLHEPASWH